MRRGTLITLIVLFVLIVAAMIAQLSQQAPTAPYPGPQSGTPLPATVTSPPPG